VKRLTFAGVNIVTLAEGDLTHLRMRVKGTMNARERMQSAPHQRPACAPKALRRGPP
jgi:hypothetical protein